MNEINNTNRLTLVKALSEKGCRVFTLQEAREVAVEIGLKPGYVKDYILYLRQSDWVLGLSRGLYSLNDLLLGETPLHEYEIAAKLIEPYAISHISAFKYHELTDQLPRDVYILTETNRTLSKKISKDIKIREISYYIVQIQPSQFFGFKKSWIGKSRLIVTDLERTLLDGLIKPKYCGGIREVIHAFELSKDKVNYHRIIEYSLKLDTSISKRLGWVLETLSVEKKILVPLMNREFKGYVKLDSSGQNIGHYNKKWQIRENI